MTNLQGQLVGYARVSSLDQNTDRQEEQLKEFHLNRLFIDKASGKSTDRSELKAALDHLREGDTFIICSMDRLARNLDDLRKIVKELTTKRVKVQFIKESMTFTGDDSPMSNLLLSVMGAFAEFERSLIRERQREGIAIAKGKGKFKGRKPSLTGPTIQTMIEQVNAGMSKTKAAEKYGISRQTLYQYLAK
jgi:DNA invertase Pin-like site-specific DNA recombinase